MACSLIKIFGVKNPNYIQIKKAPERNTGSSQLIKTEVSTYCYWGLSFLLDVDLIPISLAVPDYSLWSWNVSATTEVHLWQQNISQHLDTFYTWAALCSTVRWEVSSMWFTLQCAMVWNNSYPCLLILRGKSVMLHGYSVIIPYVSPSATNWI